MASKNYSREEAGMDDPVPCRRLVSGSVYGVAMATVVFVDETTSGSPVRQWGMDVTEERVTLRELIRRRIHHEVAEFNAAGTAVFRGLVQPSSAERTPDGYRLRPGHPVDPDEQFARAVEAFGRNGFVVLVSDHQVLSLDEEIDLARDSELTFLKLVALVGG
jgi:hypothetical protein